MATTLLEYNLDSLAVGTNIKNQGNGWYVGDQSGSSATASVQAYPTGKAGYSAGRNCVRNVTAGGLWCSIATTASYTDVDWRGTYTCSSTTGVLFVRTQNDGFFASSYGIRFLTSNTVEFVKLCGGNIYSQASYTVNHSLSSGVVFRLLMVGLVLYVWINGTYVGSYDFTGNVLCGSSVYNSGGCGALTINATQYIGGTKPLDTAGGFI
jgi:hypothetical protein